MKEYSATMEVSATKKMITNSNVVVHSNDIESVKFIHDLVNERGQPYDLTDVSDVFVTLFFGGMDIKRHPKATLSGQVEESQVSFVIPKLFLGFTGTVYCEINLSYNNDQSETAGRFQFKMTKSFIDEGTEIADIVYVEKFEDIKKEVQEKVNLIDQIVDEIVEKADECKAIECTVPKVDSVSKEAFEELKNSIDESLEQLNKNVAEVSNRLTNEVSRIDGKIQDDFKTFDGANQYIFNELAKKADSAAFVKLIDMKANNSDLINAQKDLQEQINKLKNG